MITISRLREIAEGAQAATPGPWYEGDHWVFVPPIDPENNATRALRNILRDVDEVQANAVHIANLSPEVVLELTQFAIEALERRSADNSPSSSEKAIQRQPDTEAEKLPADTCTKTDAMEGLSEVEKLAEATKALADKIEEVDEASIDIFAIAAIHGSRYTGPTFTTELLRAREALAALDRGKK